MTVELIFFVLVVLAVKIKCAYTQAGFILYLECVLIYRYFAFYLYFAETAF